MLLTAHRAKGLEFNHVAVLDGGWDRVGQMKTGMPALALLRGHDRARMTLTLARFDGRHPILDALRRRAFCFVRQLYCRNPQRSWRVTIRDLR